MAIGANHGAVEADVHGLEGGDKLQLGGNQIAFHNAVLLVEDVHDVQLEELLALAVGEGQAAGQHVHVLPGDGLAQGLGHLVLAQVGQDVGDGELGLALFLADAHGDFLAIFADDLAVEGQRDGGPLVLLDAAVVVGLQQGQLVGLVQGDGL